MNAEAPPALLGEYRTPLFIYGSSVKCRIRGQVIVTKLTDTPIPWPVGKLPGCRARALVLFGDLVDAVRRESVAAVAFYWGVTAQTVTKWRKALRVGTLNEGTTRLKSASAKESPGIAKALLKAKSKARDPERRQKIAEARRGKPRPKHVIEAMRNGRRGKPQSDETRNKIRDAHLRRGTLPPKVGRPWTEQEEAMLGKVPDAVVARMLGRKVSVVIARRHRLRIEKSSP